MPLREPRQTGQPRAALTLVPKVGAARARGGFVGRGGVRGPVDDTGPWAVSVSF
jgi:hypothetical protein